MTTIPEPPTNAAPEADIARFAADLRRLRLDAGSPTLASLQHDTGVSRTVLSEAFAGRRVPSERTVDALVRACGADPAPWLERRQALLGANEESDAGAAGRTAPPTGKSAARWRTMWIGLGAFAGGAAASAAILLLVVVPGMAYGAAEAAQITVATGEDPAHTPCVDDAEVATGDTRADNSLLEIVWSDKCQAGWGRITRYDGLYQGNTVTIAIYPQSAPDGPERQEATEHDVQGAYTTLVVRPSPDTLLCADGSFTVEGTRIDLGDPLCI